MTDVTYAFTANTKAQSALVNADFAEVAGAITPTFVFTITGTLTTGTSLTPILIVPSNLTITRAYATVKTAPIGAAITLDINKNGTSIWNTTQANRITIVDGATTGSKTAFDTTSLSADDLLTLDVDVIGSTTPGADLTVILKCEWR